MFLRDLNVLFWPHGINHRHASLPGHLPATTAWAAFLHSAAGKGGTKQDQIWFGGLFPLTCLYICNHMIPDTSWSLGPKITGINTAHTNFWTNTFIQKFYSTDTVQKHPHRHQTQGSNPTKCKAQSYRRRVTWNAPISWDGSHAQASGIQHQRWALNQVKTPTIPG